VAVGRACSNAGCFVSGPLPKYIDYGPRLTFPGPFLATGGRFLCLVLRGDAAKLGRLCEGVLSEPAQGRCAYTPLTPYVVMMIGSWTGLSSLGPGLVGAGNVPETSLTFWLPVSATDADRSSRVCLFAPYLFVDNEVSLLIGREDFGYAKALGQFDPQPVIVPPNRTTTITAYGEDPSNPGGPPGWYEAVKLEERTAGAKPTPADADVALGVAEELVALLQDPNLDPIEVVSAVFSAVKEFFESKTREVFLKQFRDASQPTRACLCEVVESPIVVRQPQVSLLSSSWDVTVTSSGTYPIYEDLGIAAQTAPVAYLLEYEMELGLGLIIA
jgi:hypothetical protein